MPHYTFVAPIAITVGADSEEEARKELELEVGRCCDDIRVSTRVGVYFGSVDIDGATLVDEY